MSRTNIKGVWAEAALKAHPEKSIQTIAAELGVSYSTVLLARKKHAGHNGTAHRMPKPPKPPKVPRRVRALDKAAQAIERRVMAGDPIFREAIVSEAGVSRGIADTALAIHRATVKNLFEAADPSTLPLSLQAKLDIATRQTAHTLRMEHAERMAQIEEEVRRRVVAEGREYLAMLKAKEAKVDRDKALYQEWTDRLIPTFTEAEFFVVLRALDPAIQHQLAKPNPERIKLMNDASALLNAKRERLTLKRTR